MPDPNAHIPMGTLTDGDGRNIPTHFDFGDFLFGIYRLTPDNRRQLRGLLDEADAKDAAFKAEAADEAWADLGDEVPVTECGYCTTRIALLGGMWTAYDGTTACTDTSAPYVPHKPKEN